MPRQTNSPQSRERRLRRLAQRLGLSVRKVASGRERGRFHLDPLEDEAPAYGKRRKESPTMTLDEVQARLEQLGGIDDGDDGDEGSGDPR